jgi:hypothetical protein
MTENTTINDVDFNVFGAQNRDENTSENGILNYEKEDLLLEQLADILSNIYTQNKKQKYERK